MKITNDRDYINRRDVEIGIATEQPFKVCVHKCWGKNLTPLMDEIKTSFKVYQYRKDNVVEYGKHELFFWTNCNRDTDGNFPQLSYFDVSLNNKTSVDERRKVLDCLIPILTKWDGSRIPCEGMPECALDSYAVVDYHSEIIEADALHVKALENMVRIGNRKCEYAGMVGHFRHSARETLFQKLRTRQFFYTVDYHIARAKEVA